MQVPTIDELKKNWKEGSHKTVARWLPHLRNEDDSFIKKLNLSNLSQLKDKLNLPPISLGADPEFILTDEKDNIVMFSSEYTRGYDFSLSEAEIGADYGLLEIRFPPVTKSEEVVAAISSRVEQFKTMYEDKLKISNKEAVEFNHELARLKEEIELKLKGESKPQYGGYHGKDCGVWGSSNNIVIDESEDVTMSAYERPMFKKYVPTILSAGGHIHIGGTFIKCLSISQLNELIRSFDEKVLPLCKSVETKAAKLREIAYGTPGEYRIKEYGIEYRSPSNAIFQKGNEKVLKQVLDVIVESTTNYMLEE